MSTLNNKNILIVDDEVQIAAFIADVLSDEGYITHTCHDGASALDRIQAAKPALMLLDIGMPILAGDELLRRLGPVEQRGFPIIVMTAGLSPYSYLECGANAVLPKPFQLDQLLSHVHQLTDAEHQSPQLAP